ncbi:hypothetical protein TWF481_006703 [Arthrobotrys musiformis]|uniref:Uncharacterized protein n=1 Tax=Arthrobotrys musiformis TaxID=47236 RepID=A0AAV9WBN9_9PEZI
MGLDEISADIAKYQSSLDSIRTKSASRRENLQKARKSPSELLHGALDSLLPLAKYTLSGTEPSGDEDDDTQKVKDMIKPVIDNLESAKKDYDKIRSITNDALKDATEEIGTLHDLAQATSNSKSGVNTERGIAERNLNNARTEKETRVTQRDEHEKKYKEHMDRYKRLTERGDSFLSKLAEAISAGTSRGMVPAMVKHYANVEKKAAEEAEQNITRLNGDIQRYLDQISNADSIIARADQLTGNLQELASNEQKAVAVSQAEVEDLNKISEGLSALQAKYSDIYAQAKIGLDVDLRTRFADTILKIIQICPLEDGLRKQKEELLKVFDTLENSSPIKERVKKQLDEAKGQLGLS